MLRTPLLVAVSSLVLTVFPVLPALAQEAVIEKTFAAGGSAELDLSGGEYRITGSPDNRIRVEWHTKNPDDARRARITVNVTGTRAVITTDGPRNGFEVRIQLPRRTHLTLDLSAGELRIRDIEGSKNVSVGAGDIEIHTGRRQELRRVNASVRIGELNARPFDVQKDGLFRSFQWNGQGTYDVNARLSVGELTLVE